MSDTNEWLTGDNVIENAKLKEYQIAPIKYVGHWCVGGYNNFAVTKRPTDEQIKNTEELFGWEWKENL